MHTPKVLFVALPFMLFIVLPPYSHCVWSDPAKRNPSIG
jgi:hypothetical protein